jgi:hypothetical protein
MKYLEEIYARRMIWVWIEATSLRLYEELNARRSEECYV